MVAFTRLFNAALLAVLYASSVGAAPWDPSSKHSTHRKRSFNRHAFHVETYNPPTAYETFGNGVEHPGISVARGDGLRKSAASFAASRLGVAEDKLTYQSGYSRPNDETSYAYLKQTHNGIPFANAVANIAFKGDKAVAFGSSFVKTDKIAPPKATIELKDAIATAEKALGATYNNYPPTLEYVAKSDGSVALTHVIQVQNDSNDNYVYAAVFVDAHDGSIVSAVDFVAEASYLVLPITKTVITEGVETVTDPQDINASPNGWHKIGSTAYTTTEGNNVVAYKTRQTNLTSQSSESLNFNYQYDTSREPASGSNLDAARVNAFYLINKIHDTAYRYGFTEAAFNFQNDNFGKGGKSNDRVLMSVQDSSGTDNANFATPPDGSSGQCRMYIWTFTSPRRDGSMENDIPIHEMTHGISNRLTGGGTGRCLQTTEAGGMGEGWSDALANWFQQGPVTSDFVLGDYVINDPAGIRAYPYSTSSKTNPYTYGSIEELFEVHEIGTVWANFLHNVYAALVSEHGFSETATTDPDQTAGNVVWFHLFIDGLAIQPCNPTLVDARDAWIQADANRYGGANKCLLWKAFAGRGLGVNAVARKYVDNFDLPTGC